MVTGGGEAAPSGDVEIWMNCNSNAKLLDLTNVQRKMLPKSSQN